METPLQKTIKEAQDGVPQAQSRLMDAFWNDVKGFLLFKTNDENLAEELTVETFTKAISKLNLYDDNFNFKTWLISIAQNNLIDYYRKRKKEDAEVLTEDYEFIFAETEPSPEKLLIDQQNLKDFYSKLDNLPEKYSEVLKLKFIDDLSIKEIANQLKLSESNVKVRIMRAKKLLMDEYRND